MRLRGALTNRKVEMNIQFLRVWCSVNLHFMCHCLTDDLTCAISALNQGHSSLLHSTLQLLQLTLWMYCTLFWLDFLKQKEPLPAPPKQEQPRRIVSPRECGEVDNKFLTSKEKKTIFSNWQRSVQCYCFFENIVFLIFSIQLCSLPDIQSCCAVSLEYSSDGRAWSCIPAFQDFSRPITKCVFAFTHTDNFMWENLQKRRSRTKVKWWRKAGRERKIQHGLMPLNKLTFPTVDFFNHKKTVDLSIQCKLQSLHLIDANVSEVGVNQLTGSRHNFLGFLFRLFAVMTPNCNQKNRMRFCWAERNELSVGKNLSFIGKMTEPIPSHFILSLPNPSRSHGKILLCICCILNQKIKKCEKHRWESSVFEWTSTPRSEQLCFNFRLCNLCQMKEATIRMHPGASAQNTRRQKQVNCINFSSAN